MKDKGVYLVPVEVWIEADSALEAYNAVRMIADKLECEEAIQNVFVDTPEED
jgi:hypothetical protein